MHNKTTQMEFCSLEVWRERIIDRPEKTLGFCKVTFKISRRVKYVNKKERRRETIYRGIARDISL